MLISYWKIIVIMIVFMNKTLNGVLSNMNEPPEELKSLPIAHLTSLKVLEKIRNGEPLQPKTRGNLETPLIYFSYGGVFHRYGKGEIIYKHTLESLPIAFVFKPKFFKKLSHFYPYDTGAAHTYEEYYEEMCNFSKYELPNNSNSERAIAVKVVYYFYGNNRNYIKTEPLEEFHELHKAEMQDMQILLNFLNASIKGVDRRQNKIECLGKESIGLSELSDDLLWIAYPEIRYQLIRQMFSTQKELKEFRYRDYHKIPLSDIQKTIENEAQEMIIKHYLD